MGNNDKFNNVILAVKEDAEAQEEADKFFTEVLENLEKKKFVWGYVQGMITDIEDVRSDSIEQKIACKFLHIMCYMPYKMRKKILHRVYMSRRDMFEYRCSHKTPVTRYF